MNIAQAKQIPLARIAEVLGGRFSHEHRKGELWYFSPFRPDEKTASFKIDEAKNLWYDFGVTGGPRNGGDGIDLWCDINRQDRKSGVRAALTALQALSPAPILSAQGGEPPIPALPHPAGQVDKQPRYKILKLHSQIWMPLLLDEISRRRISFETANRYLKQIYLQHTGREKRRLNGLAFANNQGGYEVAVPNRKTGQNLKTCLRPKSYTFIEGVDSACLDVFEGFWDFLAWQEMNGGTTPPCDSIVLNSLAFCNQVIVGIIASTERIATVRLFLDTDNAGVQATLMMIGALDDAGFTMRSMDCLYRDHKDLSDYWASDPAAKKLDNAMQGSKLYTGDSAWETAIAKKHDSLRL